MRETILLNGPGIDNENGAYGGGIGGAVRTMQAYLEGFSSKTFELKPCFNSVRQPGRLYLLAFPWRLISDTLRAVRLGVSASGMHILSQYRAAICREYSIVLVCRFLRLPVIYHIKAGAFIDWVDSCRANERKMIAFILRSSKIVLCEGLSYVEFVKNAFGVEGFYFPNVVLSSEIPLTVDEKLLDETIRVLYVGFCYEGKGVFELVRGCRLAAENGLSIRLTLVGEEASDFAQWLDAVWAAGLPFGLDRMGRLDHTEVLSVYRGHDVFVLPTRHPGEGHNNSINEAMMMGLVIVSTRQGFLESVLGEDSSYFLEDGSAQEIAETLRMIHENRAEARQKAENARVRLVECFSSDKAFERLEDYYLQITS